MSLSYRPEIDGLRAIAVTTAVLFHAEVTGFANGFVGVDIFFVISGFLITSIIARQQAGPGFSYATFVARRIRRILPALIVVMLACIPFAYWLMLPDPLENFGQSLIVTTFSANNILLWLTSGYWDLESEFKPLLHTWSLGVEEQFYILYPFLLVAALKLPFRACIAVLSVMAAVSFAWMVHDLRWDPEGAFYLLHTRAWQLLLGGIVGLLAMKTDVGRRPALAALGLVLIGASLIVWPDGAAPMALTLVMVSIGAALYLLWATADSPVTYLLTRRPVVLLGLISYSLYLWHQPVFAFLRVGMFEHPGPWMFAGGIGVSIILSVLSWRYVEGPFRDARIVTSRALWGSLGTGMAVVATVGFAMHHTDGFPHRLGYAADHGAAGTTIAYNERVRRLLSRSVPDGAAPLPVVLIAGNSFARDFANVVMEAGLGDQLTLLYRPDLSLCPSEWSDEEHRLAATLDMLIYGSGYYPDRCASEWFDPNSTPTVPTYFVGQKHFGANLNPLVRYDPDARSAIRLPILEEVLAREEDQVVRLGDRHVSLLAVLSDDGRSIRVADVDGVLLTTDRVHFSRAGAIFAAQSLPIMLPSLYELAQQTADVQSGD